MSEAKEVRLDHLLGLYGVGSGDWPWAEEYDNLIDQPDTRKLLDLIRTEGIREPILLGTDGRIWDGHHRIVIAMHLGLDSVPVEFAGEPGALAAHDTDVRASVVPEIGLPCADGKPHPAHAWQMSATGVVPEEPEWEYAVAREEWPSTPVYRRRDLEAAEAFLLNPPLGEKRHGWRIIKQRKAGPWVPVEQEGEPDE